MKLNFELEGVSVNFDGSSEQGLNLLKNILNTVDESVNKNNILNVTAFNTINKEKTTNIDKIDTKNKTDKRLHNPGLQKEILKYLSTGPVYIQELEKLLPSYLNGKVFSILNRLIVQKYVVQLQGKKDEDYKYQIAPKGRRYLELIGNRYRLDKNSSKALKQEFT